MEKEISFEERRKKIIEKINSYNDEIDNMIHYDNYLVFLWLRKICDSLNYLILEYEKFKDKQNYKIINWEYYRKEYSKYLSDNNDEIFNSLTKIAGEISEYLHFGKMDIENEKKIDIKVHIEKPFVKEINKNIQCINKKYELNIKYIGLKNKDGYFRINTSSEIINKYYFKDFMKLKYVIPDYQRSFNWELEEIINLVNSIKNRNYDLNFFYYSDKNELIDGQQRLHALYLIYFLATKNLNEDEKNEEEIDFNIERSKKRIGHNWRTNENIFLEELKKGEKEKFIKIEKIIKEDKYFLKKLNKMFVFIKKIKSKDGLKYFESINNKGMKLNAFENIVIYFLNKKNIIEKEKEMIYENWNIFDGIKNNEEKKFIIKYFESNDYKKEEINFLLKTYKWLLNSEKRKNIYWFNGFIINEENVRNLSTESYKKIYHEMKLKYKFKNNCIKYLLSIYCLENFNFSKIEENNFNEIKIKEIINEEIKNDNFKIKGIFFRYFKVVINLTKNEFDKYEILIIKDMEEEEIKITKNDFLFNKIFRSEKESFYFNFLTKKDYYYTKKENKSISISRKSNLLYLKPKYAKEDYMKLSLDYFNLIFKIINFYKNLLNDDYYK